ncbi:unnamed protein product [Rhodiola kirilowii]
MEIFRGAMTVRLRSHHDKYLIADDDRESVSQERDGNNRRARWQVELVEGSNVIRLQSCYSKYLTASDDPQYLGMTGNKVLQTVPKKLDSSIEWEPIKEGVQVKLRSRYGHFLRANGGLPPWRNSITHDIPHRSATQDWILWNVDVLQHREVKKPPPLKPIISRSSSSESDLCYASSNPSPKMSSGHKVSGGSSIGSPMPAKSEGRLISYKVARDHRDVDETIIEQNSFHFKGNRMEDLKVKLAEETGLDEEEFIVCSRNPFNGKLYPLKLHLPPNHAPMNLFVVPSSSKVAMEIASRESPRAI